MGYGLFQEGNILPQLPELLGANIWDVQQEKLIKTMQYGLPGHGIPVGITISPDNKYVLIGLASDSANNIIVYDPNIDKEITRFNCGGTPLAIKFSHDGTKFVVAYWYKTD